MRFSIATATCLLAALPRSIQQHLHTSRQIQAPVWAANFTTATTSSEAGFRRVQYQYVGEDSPHNYEPGSTGTDMSIPVTTHPLLGRALQIHLNTNQMRWEAFPGGPKGFKAGDDYYFRVDFVLDTGYPISQYKKFNSIQQIHQGAETGSPPVAIAVQKDRINIHGSGPNDTRYNVDLGPAHLNTKYKVVYRVKFATTPQDSLVEAWINDVQVLTAYQPNVPTILGGESYWKGATAYCDPSLSPFTVYQNAHRVGTSLASVN